MKAVILAAGRGSRMMKLTQDRPKCLVELGGRSLLDLQLNALGAGGARDIAVVGGYRSEFFDGRNVTVFENARWAETNMVASLMCAASWLREEPCIVSYSDIFYPIETVRRIIKGVGDVLITFDPEWEPLWRARFADPLSDAETFKLDSEGRVTSIGGRAKTLDEINGQYMGLLKFTPAGWREVERYVSGFTPDKRDKIDMTQLLSQLINEGVEIRAVPTVPGWGEVDSESDLDYYTGEVNAGRIQLV